MAWDDYVYVALIVANIPLGFIGKHINGYTNRLLYCGLVGFVLALIAFQTRIWHSIFTVVGSYFIIKFCSIRYCHVASFVFNFGYLAFFRMAGYFGFEEVSTGTPNAVQLILSLKLISVAFDMRDAVLQKADGKKDDDKPSTFPADALNVGPLEFFGYSYCFLGLFTGPFFRYKTFHHYLNQPDLNKLPTAKKALQELTYVPFYLFVFLILQKYFPVEYIATDEYLNHPGGFLYRVLYAYPCVLWFRWRFYIAWQLAVCGFTLAGFGAFPKDCDCRSGLGPSKMSQKYKKNVLTVDNQSGEFVEDDVDFTTVKQLRVWQIETITRTTGAFMHWNMTVQFWMYYYVSQKFPVKQFRRFAVFVTGAYWHGLHMGYYLAFLVILFNILGQEGFVKVTGPLRRIPSKWIEYFWNVIDWCISWQIYQYNQASFRLLRVDDTLRVWASVYYYGHILTVIFIFLGLIFPSPRSKKKDDKKSE